MLCHLLECLLTPKTTPPDCPKELYELYFAFACVWAFGAQMFQDQVSGLIVYVEWLLEKMYLLWAYINYDHVWALCEGGFYTLGLFYWLFFSEIRD